MARHVEGPWYRKQTDSWYFTRDGKNVPLGVKGKGNRPEAVVAWHRRMAGWENFETPPDPKPAHKPCARSSTAITPAPSSSLTVSELAALFLSDGATRFKPSTLKLYRDDMRTLCKAFGSRPAGELTPQDLTKWLAGMAVSQTTKGVLVGSVSSCYGWAVRNELVQENPARRVKKPKARSRGTEAVIGDEDHATLLGAATPDFAIVLRVLHATGCRPSEACAITAASFDAANAVVTLTVHKSDATGRPRLIFLPPDVVALLNVQLARYGSGPLLRSRKGVPWTSRAITRAMQRLQAKTGLNAIAYGYRHTYATAALANAIPDATVAALLGHTSTAMLHKHYAHLTAHGQTLRDAATKVRPVK